MLVLELFNQVYANFSSYKSHLRGGCPQKRIKKELKKDEFIAGNLWWVMVGRRVFGQHSIKGAENPRLAATIARCEFIFPWRYLTC